MTQDVHPPHLSDEESRNEAFLDAVMRGDEDAVTQALAAGADVNATDAAGRSSLACAITGPNWEAADASDASFMTESRVKILQHLVEHPQVSLYTLNAPQYEMRGVTPLGLAAWLNASEAVRVCLDVGSGAVAVDAPDEHGVTPLMYAVRDGRKEVAECLLSHGARSDVRDVNHRSPVQYAIPHRQVLWLCERSLRLQRCQETKSRNPCNLCPKARDDLPLGFKSLCCLVRDWPPDQVFTRSSVLTTTSNLIKSIISSDVSSLQSLLFPTPPSRPLNPTPTEATPLVLVNSPDNDGWSPIHYCTSVRQPSIEVLDLLYRAGADINLFSIMGNCTPLHCLARKKRGPDTLRDAHANRLLYDFVVHLVRDFRVPLAALNSAKETCVHLAAEFGDSTEVLRALLDCDKDRSVREMRNARGLTPLEVAKPEFRSVFGIHDEENRPASAASLLTVRPLRHISSTPSISSFATSSTSSPPILTPRGSPDALPSPDIDTSLTPFERLIDVLRSTAGDRIGDTASDLNRFEASLRDASACGEDAFGKFRARIAEFREHVTAANATWTEADGALDTTAQALDEKAQGAELSAKAMDVPSMTPGEFCGRSRSGTTFSSDSRRTTVSIGDSGFWEVVSKVSSQQGGSDTNTRRFPSASQAGVDDQGENDHASDGSLTPWPVWLDPGEYNPTRSSSPYLNGSVHSRLKAFKSMSDLQADQNSQPPPPSTTPPVSRRARADTLSGIIRRPETSNLEKSSTGRLKAWFKKKLMPERSVKVAVALRPTHSRKPTIAEPRSSLGTLCEANENPDQLGKDIEAMAGASDQRHPAYGVLATAGKDLAKVDACISNADKLLSSALRAVSRADRLAKRAIRNRTELLREQRMIAEGSQISSNVETVAPLNRPSSLTLDIPARSRVDSFCSISSPSSIVSSLPSPLPSPSLFNEERDDDDATTIERMVSRKVHDRIELAIDELERVDTWLGIIQTVLRGVQNQAGIRL